MVASIRADTVRPIVMFRIVRSFLVVACCGFVCWSIAQGGAAGYGQGGMGGGAGGVAIGGTGTGTTATGGGMGGDVSGVFADRAKAPKRVEDSDESNAAWQTKTAVLTPGDRVEFKLKMRKGETIIAGATSDAFDPALSIVDSKGKELIKNDDREEGDQAPLVVYRFAEAGNYTLKVLSYRSVSGGKFTLKLRSFVAIDAALGVGEHEGPPLADTDPTDRITFRLACQKGKIYDLHHAQIVAQYGNYELGITQVIGPTGVARNDFVPVEAPGGGAVLQALADGDYYLEYVSQTALRYRTDFRAVPVVSWGPRRVRASAWVRGN